MQLAESREKEKGIVEYASGKNAIITEDALELLQGAEDFRGIIDGLLEKNVFVIDREKVEQSVRRTKISLIAEKAVEVQKKSFAPLAREMPSKLRILGQYDVTGQSKSEGTAKDFLHYFQRKFELLSGILRKRHSLSPKPIKRLRAVPKRNAVDLIGMVFKKWVTKNGHIAMQLEDLDAKCIALVLKDDAALTALAEHVMLDDVVGVRAIKWNEGLMIAKEILWPDLPVREQKKAETDLAIAAISDMHVGSKLFLEKPFNSFLEWINGRHSSRKEREKVGRIKYLVIAGDNVDGIGIYPGQFSELNIKDISQQYKEFSRLIMQVPDYIEIIVCPGQHDAVRWADPQPAVPKEFVEELYERDNVHFVGSPSWFEVDGLKAMVYHGAALHDLIGSVSFLNYDHPEQAMIETLKRRDIMTAYGMKQPYVAEREDFMVIREEPDLVFLGDMHHNAYGNYRGTTVINSGTWQSRTAYQVKLGHVPTPCIVPMMNLGSGKISENRFLFTGEEKQ